MSCCGNWSEATEEDTTSGLFTNMNVQSLGKVKLLGPLTNQGLFGWEEASGAATCPPYGCHPAVLDTCSRKGHSYHPNMGRVVTAVRELLQWEHTAEYKPGIVSKRDKFRPNLLQNNSPIKCTQSVLIHP